MSKSKLNANDISKLLEDLKRIEAITRGELPKEHLDSVHSSDPRSKMAYSMGVISAVASNAISKLEAD